MDMPNFEWPPVESYGDDRAANDAGEEYDHRPPPEDENPFVDEVGSGVKKSEPYDFGPPPKTQRLGIYDRQMGLKSTALGTLVEAPSELVASRSFRFQAISGMQLKPIAWLIHGYFEADSLATIFGPSGEGKTFIVLDMACSIAAGRDYHGNKVEPGAVFYILGEGKNGIYKRAVAWSVANKVSLDDMPLYLSETAADFASATGTVRVIESIEELSVSVGVIPKLIVVDTMARNFSGEENSATEVGNMIRHIDQLRHKWKCTVLIVHHSGKGEAKGARGSTALKGAMDAEFEVSRSDTDKIVRLAPRKMKEAERPEPLAFELVSVPLIDSEGSPIAGAALRQVDYTAATTLSKSGMGKNQKTALEALQRLYADHRKRLTDDGREPSAARVSISDWKQESQLDSRRWPEAIEGLDKARLIRLEHPYVVLF